jgi:hypothetical protein
VALVLRGSVIELPNISGNSSGACHLSVPFTWVAVKFVLATDVECITVATPKSAIQALCDGETSILSYSSMVKHIFSNIGGNLLTPLRSPWMMFSLCKYPRPCATSRYYRKAITIASACGKFIILLTKGTPYVSG